MCTKKRRKSEALTAVNSRSEPMTRPVRNAAGLHLNPAVPLEQVGTVKLSRRYSSSLCLFDAP